MIKQLISLTKYHNIPLSSARRGWLTLGGSTDLEKNSSYYAGDLSGITVKNLHFGFNHFINLVKKFQEKKIGIKN